MKGEHVLRKAGWDTHGLPVELEVEKLLGLDGKPQIESYFSRSMKFKEVSTFLYTFFTLRLFQLYKKRIKK